MRVGACLHSEGTLGLGILRNKDPTILGPPIPEPTSWFLLMIPDLNPWKGRFIWAEVCALNDRVVYALQ